MEWVIPAVLVVLLGWGTLIRARLKRLHTAAVEAWPPLAAALQRRHALVTPLVKTLEPLPRKSQRPLQNLVKARKAALVADLSPQAAGAAEHALETAIIEALIHGEAFPDQVDTARLAQFADAFEQAAERISAAAEAFNEAAFAYNSACVGSPVTLVAKLSNYWPLEYFGLDLTERGPTTQNERGQAAEPGAPMA
ncbi:LemA family protein [Roseococcus sp. SDR]|uniref:LemA family protein n=1 Tax=Roseococcus sp. SDR TaxID=2835532 RepID=UPI001BCC85D2|nr:LemA family protein [Roseococcus sp. SDR]MBS7789074.1 LemA family protein [Roseococcus sp. SDR]MBV1844388.1 LemA family protein [Roseococcus sp. SDR]